MSDVIAVCLTTCSIFFQIFERILFIWAIRHPASGYVQGINDLVTPFFVVFICEHTGKITSWCPGRSTNRGRQRPRQAWSPALEIAASLVLVMANHRGQFSL